MNKNILFGFLVCITTAFLMYIAHNIQGETVKDKIDYFEKNHKTNLNEIVLVFSNNVDLDTNYSVQWWHNSQEVRFTYIDTSGKSENFFKPNLQLSKKQIDFFRATYVGSLQYFKAKRIFELNYENLFIVISVNSSQKKMETKPKPYFQNGNYSYYLQTSF